MDKVSQASLDWISDTFEVGGLGAASVCGTREQGILRSLPGAGALDGEPVDFYAYWSGSGPELAIGPVVAAGAGGAKLAQRDLDQVCDLVEMALQEWWTSTDAHELLEENARRSQVRQEMAQRAQQQAIAAVRVELAGNLVDVANQPWRIEELARTAAEQEDRIARTSLV